MKLIDVYGKIRELLKSIPNKTTFYRDFGIPKTYLVIRRFMNGKMENLPDTGINYLTKPIGYSKIDLFINSDKLTDEEKTMLNNIQNRFLEDLKNKFENYSGEKRYPGFDDIKDEDIKSMKEALGLVTQSYDFYNTDFEEKPENNEIVNKVVKEETKEVVEDHNENIDTTENINTDFNFNDDYEFENDFDDDIEIDIDDVIFND